MNPRNLASTKSPEGGAVSNQGVAAVERAIRILLAFQQGESTLSLAELARRTGLYKSTILRLATTLCAHGLLGRQSDGDFRLGPVLLKLGSLYQESYRLQDVVLPVMSKLMQITGESVRFYIRQGEQRVLLFSVDSPQPLREHIVPGHSAPIDATATGQVFKAMEVPDGRRKVHFPIQTSGIKDPLTSSCAAPVITSDGVFLGVITISGPTARFTAARRKLAGKILMECVASLTPCLRGLPFIS
jgi:DNA-binding IclR family transcriptional regulator